MCGVRERRVKRKKIFVETKFIFQESHVFRIEKFYLKNPIIENQTHVKKGIVHGLPLLITNNLKKR